MVLLFIIVIISSIPAFLKVKIIEDDIEVVNVICFEEVQYIGEDILAGIFIPANKKDEGGIFYHKCCICHKSRWS